MASLCKRQQCTIDRRGFRQELDSWRHKLIHCVGFESILEGLFGSELVQDLQLFKDREPLAVSDWSFDENCIFCCLRRNKVKEHLSSLSTDGLEDPPKPLLVKDQTLLIKLERQAEEFLSAVLRRKDVPNFSDPHVPVVAREILQGMIRQFAAEYTSKSSPQPQEPSASQPHSDQSLPCAQPLSPPLSSAHNLNPVLSKLLMIDQDAPLDLTIKKPPAEPTEQDGVLDLSIKKNRSFCHSPLTSTPKGEPREVQISKIKDLQAASTLEQFMSKLCLHHQRQIISAIGFVQAEVKALTSTKSSQPVTSAHALQKMSCTPVASPSPAPTRPSSEPSKSYSNPDVRSNASICPKLKLSVTPAPHVVASRTSPSPTHTPTPTTTPTIETKSIGHGDHAPLKLKIMKTGSVAAGNKLACVLTTSLSPQPGEDKPGRTSSSEMHRARLNSSSKKQNHSNHTHPVKQSVGQGEDSGANPFSFHGTVPANSPRTARKSIRPSAERHNNDFNDRVILDPDLGHCDIVYINKPITECFKKRHRGMAPRRNARKSTRGLMYADEIWELKTVRTLAGRGNCPNPLLDFNTSVTPKQNLSKPEGVPPVDMPCAGECTEAMDQQMATQEPTESELSETGQAKEAEGSDVALVVETSQTDQSQVIEEAVCPSKQVDSMDKSVDQDIPAEVEKPSENDIIPQALISEIDVSQNIEENNSVQQILPVSDSVEKKEGLFEESEKDNVTEEPNLESQTESVIIAKESTETEGGSTDVQSPEEFISQQKAKVEEKTSKTIVCEQLWKELDVSSKTMEELANELPPWRRKKGSISSTPKFIAKTEEVIVGFVSGKPVSASDRSLRRRSGQVAPPKEMPKQIKRRQKVQSKADGDSNTESSDLEKPLSVEQEPEPAKTESCSSILPVTEPASNELSSNPNISADNSNTDQQKEVEESEISTCNLKSSGPIVVECPTVPISVTPTTTSESVVTSKHLATESEESSAPVVSTPPPTSSHAVEETSPETTVMSLPSTTSMESNIDEVSEPSKDQPHNNRDSPVLSKPIHIPAKIVAEESKLDKEDSDQVSIVESTAKSEPQPQAMSLRRKRTLQVESEPAKSSTKPKPNVEAQVESSSADSSCPIIKKPARMPLRSEGLRLDQSPPAEEKRLSLRSQRQTTAVVIQSEMSSPIRMTKSLARPTPVTQSTSTDKVLSSKSEPLRPPSVKFLEALNGAQNQQLITNLNLKFDKMHKGWMQLDKEGQPTPKHRNKADRQAAIWKSKKRVRKPKVIESSKYSPVQMLFMKGFDLSTICEWFLETTETKSLVIVKKVNTRLPSETQLCFHSSGASGSAQGIYPSLQAERLKKHLKKFAIASPVKSNPKTQKLIAKALEQELIGVVKGKEKKEVTSAVVRKLNSSTKREPQKPKNSKTQNPASARILRKYSNIREKQANARLKEKSNRKASLKSLKKGSSKSNLKSLKSTPAHVKKPQIVKENLIKRKH
ncbi:hypothetical protein WMY93_007246 [Mugilogobius chulae]|uniref:Ligand-dependent nuclear receptor corepressor-like protein n=1 Tax=Mugilogobius chulae TaxID=88201 RepID=A0AAW0PYE3_9GOBI